MSGQLHAPFHEPAEAPTFIRRCRYRNVRSTAFSEKLGATIGWTTPVQCELGTMLEVTHQVVSYDPWPGPVTVNTGRGGAHEYWPAMGILSHSGEQTLVDVVHPDDEAERDLMKFEPALRDALEQRGIGLMTIRRGGIANAWKMRVARDVRRHTGCWPTDEGAEAHLLQMVQASGGSLPLGTLPSTGAFGNSLLAAACVLVMRRRLKLTIEPGGLASSTVSVGEERAAR